MVEAMEDEITKTSTDIDKYKKGQWEFRRPSLRRRDQIWADGQNSTNINLMLMELRGRNYYWKSEGICFETIQM